MFTLPANSCDLPAYISTLPDDHEFADVDRQAFSRR